MTAQRVNKSFCLGEIESYCDLNDIALPERLRRKAATIMLGNLTEGEFVEMIPQKVIEDTAYMATIDVMTLGEAA